MVTALSIGLLFNMIHLYVPEYLDYAPYLLIVIFPFILIYGSIRFGERLDASRVFNP